MGGGAFARKKEKGDEIMNTGDQKAARTEKRGRARKRGEKKEKGELDWGQNQL